MFDNFASLGFGLMRLPANENGIDIPQVEKMVDTFLEKGFTYFDTAYVYNGGKSEEAAFHALVSRHPRESFTLADKLPMWKVSTKEEMLDFFNTSLSRTGAGYFDYYLLHALGGNATENAEKSNAWDFVKELKQQGKIKHFGFSFHDTAEKLEEILKKHPDAEFVQLQINYKDWEDERVQSKACYEVARKYNKPIMIMEPIKGGSLASMPQNAESIVKEAAGDSPVASLALRFAASLDGVAVVLSGMSNYEQVAENTALFIEKKKITEKDLSVINRVVYELNKNNEIQCTQCSYCTRVCPQKIAIPNAIEALNTYRTYGNLSIAVRNYKRLVSKEHDATNCVGCKACEEVCPQKINISKCMKEAAEELLK